MRVFLAVSVLNCLCIVDTHDIELTRLLGKYRHLYSVETLTKTGMKFPYKVLEGPCGTRNAIVLMKQMSFSEEMTLETEEAAKAFDAVGKQVA